MSLGTEHKETSAWISLYSKKAMFILLVTFLTVIYYIFIKPSLLTIEAQLELGPADVLASNYRVSSYYPDDFIFVSNIRSSDLIQTWINSNRHNPYCTLASRRIHRRQSRMYIDKIDRIAGLVFLSIDLYTMSGTRRTHGGDVIFVWAESNPGSPRSWFGRVAGIVTDHLNGTYSVCIKMLWTGPVLIKAKVVAKSGISCTRLRAIQKYGNSVFAVNTPYGIFFTFQKNGVTEATRCSPIQYVFGFKWLCNFTEINFGLSWYCGHPKHPQLRCSDYTRYKMSPYDKHAIGLSQTRDEVIDDPIVDRLYSMINVYFHVERQIKHLSNKTNYSSSMSWIGPYPTGYSWNGHWKLLYERNQILNEKTVKACLLNKLIMFIGDSTIRQYVEDLANLLKIRRVVYKGRSPFMSFTVKKLRLRVEWRKHEMPYHNMRWYNQTDLNSTFHQIHMIADNPSISDSTLCIVLTYNTHLQAFSTDVFRSRIRAAVKAIKYLLYKKPGAKVFFKGPHSPVDANKWFDARIVLLFRDVIYEEFRELIDRVIYLDTLSVSIAYGNELLHPKGETLRAQTEQFLSYLC